MAHRKTGLFFQALILWKHLVCLPPNPQELCKSPALKLQGWSPSSCSWAGQVSWNLSFTLKTEFLFKRAEGPSTWLHLILSQKGEGTSRQPQSTLCGLAKGLPSSISLGGRVPANPHAGPPEWGGEKVPGPQGAGGGPCCGWVPAPSVQLALRGHYKIMSPPRAVRGPSVPMPTAAEMGQRLCPFTPSLLIRVLGWREVGFLEPPKQAGVSVTTTNTEASPGWPTKDSTLSFMPRALGPGASFHRVGRQGRTWT